MTKTDERPLADRMEDAATELLRLIEELKVQEKKDASDRPD